MAVEPVLQSAAHGVPSFTATPTDVVSAGGGEGVPSGQWSVAPYRGGKPSKRDRKCVADGDTCNGWRVKGTSLCAGHYKAAKARGEVS